MRCCARWKDLPPKYGRRSTCHRRLQEWQEQGVWEGIRLKFLSTLDAQAKLDWNEAFLDGSFVPGKKQLSLMSRMLNIRSPGLLMFDHGVQDNQELVHASRQSHFPRLAHPTKTVVKGLDDGIIPAGSQSSHIEGSPDPGPSAPDRPFAPEAVTVSVEGSDSHQRGNLVATQSAQFRKVGQEGDGHHPAD